MYFHEFGQRSSINRLSAKITKCSNTLKQFVGNLPTNCLSVFDHFVGLALKGLNFLSIIQFLKILLFTYVFHKFSTNVYATA